MASILDNPHLGIYFLWLIRVFSAFLAQMDDCDEVYNYWEPLHMAVEGTPAMQTWEYSGVYGLRTWAYIRDTLIINDKDHLDAL
jgi:alpha-1,2-mannosyltransferase